jgi:catecholate siderophore receptor
VPGGDVTRYFGSPDLNVAPANVDTVMAFVEHDFGGGLSVKNSSYFADYKKFYQNVHPGNGPLSGAINPIDTAFSRAAYNHETDRENLFNQTDFVFKGSAGPIFHTMAFGTEFERRQASICVTPASFRTAPTRSSAIRGTRPISDRSPSSICFRGRSHPASARPIRTANTA